MPGPFPGPIRQLGYVVADLDTAVERWLALGIGPWLTMRNVALDRYEYRGTTSRARLDLAFAQDGDLQIELIRPLDDEPSSYRDFLAAHGSGLQHLAWWTDDFTATDAAARGAGLAVVQRGEALGTHYAYYDTIASTGLLAEVMELTDAARWLVDAVRSAAGGWDGVTDPVRSLI